VKSLYEKTDQLMSNRLKLFIEFSRIVRFGIVGIVATLVYAAATLLAIEILHMTAVPASIIGQLTATGVSYFGHSMFSFAVKTDHKTYFVRFLLILLLTLALNSFVTWLLTDFWRISHRISVAIVTILIPLVNYICSRYWIFVRGMQTPPAVQISSNRAVPKKKT
jgi:putative flippase GtrA